MKTNFTTITTLVFFILGITVSANQSKSEIGKRYFLAAKNGLYSISKTQGDLKHPLVSGNQLSVPGYSEDFSWDEDLNDWLHYSNTTYTYDEVGGLTEEIAQEAETDIYLTRDTYSYGSGKTFEEVSYIWTLDEWNPVNGEKRINTIFEFELTGTLVQTIENGIWVNKTLVKYIMDMNNIPTRLDEYHWDGNDWILHSRMGLLTWADWPNRELAAYTKQNLQDGNWVNAERYSKQYDGGNYTTTTEVWENNAWVNSERQTYLRTEFQEEIVLENWTETGWEKAEKYMGTFDAYGNPTGMFYSSWYDTSWELEMELFFDLLYNEANDVTEMIVRYRDPEISEPVNISKYKYSSFLHFTTDVPEINVLNNVKVYPNPVNSTLTVKIDDNNSAKYELNIVNLAGQTIFSNTYSDPLITINTESFTTGMYLLNIKSDNGRIYNSKLLKN
jgi:hypothetical protein